VAVATGQHSEQSIAASRVPRRGRFDVLVEREY